MHPLQKIIRRISQLHGLGIRYRVLVRTDDREEVDDKKRLADFFFRKRRDQGAQVWRKKKRKLPRWAPLADRYGAMGAPYKCPYGFQNTTPSCVASFANMATSTRASARARASQNMAEINMPPRSGQSVTVIAWRTIFGATISRTSTRAMLQCCRFWEWAILKLHSMQFTWPLFARTILCPIWISWGVFLHRPKGSRKFSRSSRSSSRQSTISQWGEWRIDSADFIDPLQPLEVPAWWFKTRYTKYSSKLCKCVFFCS